MDEEEVDQQTNEILEKIRNARNNDETTALDLIGRGIFYGHSGIFTAQAAASTIDCLVDTPRITSLRIRGYSFTDDALDVLRDRLPSCLSVTKLTFKGTELGNGGLRRLARMPIKALELCESGINGAPSDEIIGYILAESDTLQELDLSGNEGIGTLGIGQGLAHEHCILQRLNLWSCHIGNEGVANLLLPFGETTNKNKSLTALSLSVNNIVGADGGQNLRRLLENFECLQSLNLYSNPLGPDGAHGLILGLQGMPPLVHLNLSSCSLGNRSVQVLSEGITAIKNLKELRIGNNGITSQGLDAVINILSRCKKMNLLDISGNRDIFKGQPTQVRASASALSKHKCLQELRIEFIEMNEWVQEALLVGIDKSAVLCVVGAVGCETRSLGFVQEYRERLNLLMERNRMLANLDHDALGTEPTRSVAFLDALEEARRHKKGLTVIWEIVCNHHKKILPQPSSTTAPATDMQAPAHPAPAAAAAAAAAIGEDPRTQTEGLSRLEAAVLFLERSLHESNQNHLAQNNQQMLHQLIGRLQTMRDS